MGVKIKFDEKAFEKAVKQQAVNAVQNRKFDVTCPHCQKTFHAYSGINVCPFCQKTVELTLNIHF